MDRDQPRRCAEYLPLGTGPGLGRQMPRSGWNFGLIGTWLETAQQVSASFSLRAGLRWLAAGRCLPRRLTDAEICRFKKQRQGNDGILGATFAAIDCAQIVDRSRPSKSVILGTGNSRQSGANRDLFHVNHAIPYQQRTAIDFVPIFPNAWLWERAD